MNWNPIDTVPKHKIVLLARWYDGRSGWTPCWEFGVGHYGIMDAIQFNGLFLKPGDIEPTHWMPLPDPPQVD